MHKTGTRFAKPVKNGSHLLYCEGLSPHDTYFFHKWLKLQAPVKLTTSRRFKLTRVRRSKLTTPRRSKLTT